MARQRHLDKLETGVAEWNAWRARNHGINPNLTGANLAGTDLSGVDLNNALLISVDLRRADLRYANLSGADLRKADLTHTRLYKAAYRKHKRPFPQSRQVSKTLKWWPMAPWDTC